MHGSGGNKTSGWRRAYIVAFRSAATVAWERAHGFTHSHNDQIEVLKQVGFATAEASRDVGGRTAHDAKR
jgi:hypothetical protein